MQCCNQINKKKDIIVSGHSPRNEKYRKNENGERKVYYDNVDIWAEDWANEKCWNNPIIFPAEELNRKEFFLRNKKIALEIKKLIVFMNRRQYKSGAWNTVSHFSKREDFNYANLIIYDQYGKLWRTDELPSWLKSKIIIRPQ